jgi:hypothetical protein
VKTLRRLFFRLRNFRNYNRMLTRRVAVEQILLDIANGKQRPLTLPEYRLMAFYLAGAEESLPKRS